jgi:inosine-uridine nucleoside N-ribohydrolase
MLQRSRHLLPHCHAHQRAGHDDALAILLAGYHARVQLLGLSTVASNQVVEKTTRNALDVLDWLGLHSISECCRCTRPWAGTTGRTRALCIHTHAARTTCRAAGCHAVCVCVLLPTDVVKGQAGPLLRPTAINCPEIHGETGALLTLCSLPARVCVVPTALAVWPPAAAGLDGPDGGPVLPHSARQPLPGKAPIVMFEAIRQAHEQHPEAGRVQLVCTGALSNAALLLLLFPEVKPMIDITIMGGAMGVSPAVPPTSRERAALPTAAPAATQRPRRMTCERWGAVAGGQHGPSAGVQHAG